jgi:DNA-binding HxlR family transcriptional regulator
MLRSDYASQNCSAARTLEVVGERWTLLVVRDLLLRPRRFSELASTLGIAKNVLSNRLDTLIEYGLVDRIRLPGRRDWAEYRLTNMGRDLYPVIIALRAWGDKYQAPNGPPVIVEHTCGHPAGHKLVCASCGVELVLRDLHVVAGPGWMEGTTPN